MTALRLLVTGRHGQLAGALIERASADLEVICLGRPVFDLAEPAALPALMREIRPDVVVNAAAYTQVDQAELEPERAFAVNAAGAGAVARAAHEFGAPVIQISTDYVFDGSQSRPLMETDPTGPLNVYGRTKLAGEALVAAAAPDHVVLRTAWLYAPSGANFLRTMLRLAATRAALKVVGDQRGRPTSALDLAEAVERIARRLVAEPGNAALRGTFHLTASGEPASWADFAAEIFRQSGLSGGPIATVAAIPSSDYPTRARRPAYSCLDCGKLAERYGLIVPDWQAGLSRVIERIAASGDWT